MELNVIKDLIPLLDANSESIVTSSAEALRLLCTEPAAEQMIVDNSGLSALVRVLSRGSAVITTKSPIPAVLGVMSQLCNSRTACDRLVKFGVIQSMKSMLQRDMDGVCQARILKLLERITTSQSQDRCAAQPCVMLLFWFLSKLFDGSCRDALLAAGPVAMYDRREFTDGCPAPPSAYLAESLKLPQIVRKFASSRTPAVQQTAQAVELNFPAISGLM
jgi:hypothetical protein